jgi:Poly(ADP-ribose) polymerase catalytic domain
MMGAAQYAKALQQPTCSSIEEVLTLQSYKKVSALSEFIVERSELADLLITLLYCASHGGRVLLAFPSKSVRCGNRSFFDQTEAPDLALLQSVLTKMPAVADMAEHARRSEGALEVYLETIDTLLFPLLEWLIEPHFACRILNEDEKPDGVTCDWIVSVQPHPADADKEMRFQEIKAASQKGSRFGFHGSCTGNFHSILRQGIKIMSGTEYQTTGTSYGRGVYMGSHSSISQSYCSKAKATQWPLSKFAAVGPLIIMALVELVDDPANVKTHACSSTNTGGTQIFVAEVEEIFVTRFLFINPSSEICTTKLLGPCLRIIESHQSAFLSQPADLNNKSSSSASSSSEGSSDEEIESDF